MAWKIQFRRGTASAWTTANPTLSAGEPGVETGTGLFKVGDGTTAWTSLPYQAGSGGGGVDAAAIHAATSKTPPVDADELPLVDSAGSFGLKKLTMANLKAWVKSWITKTDVGLGNVTNNAQYFPGGTDVTLADGGTGTSLADPNADRIMFWDDSAGAVTWLTPGTNLTITGTTLDATGGGGGSGDATAAASTLALRDGSANLLADAFIPSATSTVTAASTTTLTVNSAEIQIFTGSTTQIVALPTTGIVAGQRYSINSQSTGSVTVTASGGGTVIILGTGQSVIATAIQSTPTTAAHWGIAVGSPLAGSNSAAASSVAQRNADANLVADAFIATATSTATGAGTTTLTIASSQVQVFTGTTTQTVLLPTTSVVAGQMYTIVNNSTGIVTVQSSGANTVATIAAGATQIFAAQVATPTTAAHWQVVVGYSPGGTDVAITDGGTGASTLPSGLLKGAGTSAITAAIPGADYVSYGGALGTPTSGLATNLTGLPASGLSAAGTRDATTVLYGDNAWRVPPGGGGGSDPSINKWVARNPGSHLVPVMRTSYYDKSNTAWASLPTTWDTGQSITYSAGTAPDQLFISNGGLTIPQTAGSSVAAAGYVNVDSGFGNNLTRVGIKFKFDQVTSTTLGGTVALVMSNGAFLGSGGTAFRMVHFTLTYHAWVLQTVSNATNALVFTDIASGTLVNDLEWTNGTEYTCEMWRVGNTITILLPDGQRVTVTDSNISTYAGRYGYYQNFLNFRNTDNIPSITEAWADSGAQYPPGNTGLVTRDDLDAASSALATGINPQTGTTYTLVAGDSGKVVTANNASAITITVPQNSAAAIPIGAYIEFTQLGAGQVTFVAGTGATLRSRGSALKINGQYGTAGLRKIAANEFVLAGDLTT